MTSIERKADRERVLDFISSVFVELTDDYRGMIDERLKEVQDNVAGVSRFGEILAHFKKGASRLPKKGEDQRCADVIMGQQQAYRDAYFKLKELL